MIRSMTAFASRQGDFGATRWSWEMRGVNGRGLDLRLRVPDGLPGLEPALRQRLSARLSRGNVTLTLRLARNAAGGEAEIDMDQLDAVLAALGRITARAARNGLSLSSPSAADLLALRGVAGPAREEEDPSLVSHLLDAFDAMLEDFVTMREGEGRALAAAISGRLDEIAALADRAARAAAAREPEARAALTAALRRVAEDVPELDETRLAQELALIAVRQDVTEEIERLRAHVAAARDLLSAGAPAGRRLDFLAQEFNREANTLCSKAQATGLTVIGLDLKAAIDQMREQIQNVE